MATKDVAIKDFSYAPPEITINNGDTVRWTNTGNATHTVTAADGSFDSGDISNGDPPFEQTFNSAGEVKYLCSHHGNMKGKITVVATAAIKDVAIKDFSYSPAAISINKGDTVRWTNIGNATHTVTADDGSFDSGDVSNGDPPFEQTLNVAGTVKYHCAHHGNMKGTITVT